MFGYNQFILWELVNRGLTLDFWNKLWSTFEAKYKLLYHQEKSVLVTYLIKLIVWTHRPGKWAS